MQHDNPRSRALLEALDIINGARQAEYGPPAENFQRIANRWSERHRTSAYDVCVAMIDLKVARLGNKYSRDSLIDIIGYAALAIEMQEVQSDKYDMRRALEEIRDVANVSDGVEFYAMLAQKGLDGFDNV